MTPRLRRLILLGSAVAGVIGLAASLAVIELADQSPARQRRVLQAGAAVTNTSSTLAAIAPANGPPFACGTLDLTPGTRTSATATLGSLTATLTGTVEAKPGISPDLSSPLLTIRESATVLGALAVEAPALDTPPALAHVVIPWSIGPIKAGSPGDAPQPDLCVARFAGQDRPTVLLGLSTGGAHCCTVVRAVPLTATGLGRSLEFRGGNAALGVAAAGDHAILVTANDAFAYQFSSFGGSGLPVQVLELRGNAFVDTTAEHPDLVRADATRMWDQFGSASDGGLGLLAPWVADQCLLGQGSQAWATVDRLQAQGKLAGQPNWPSGAAFVGALHTFLAQHDYCS